MNFHFALAILVGGSLALGTSVAVQAVKTPSIPVDTLHAATEDEDVPFPLTADGTAAKTYTLSSVAADYCSGYNGHSSFEPITIVEDGGYFYRSGTTCQNGRNGPWEVCPEWFSGTDYEKLQKAAYAAGELHRLTGQRIYVDLKAGEYLIDGLVHTCRSTSFYGQGLDVTIVRAAQNSPFVNMFTAFDATEFQSLKLDGNNTMGTGLLVDWTGAFINGITLQNFVFHGAAVRGHNNRLQFFNSNFNRERGVNISEGATGNVVADFYMYGNTKAGVIIGHTSDNNTVQRGRIYATHLASLWLQQDADNNTFEDISIESPTGDPDAAVIIWNSRRNKFKNITIRDHRKGFLLRGSEMAEYCDACSYEKTDGDTHSNVLDGIDIDLRNAPTLVGSSAVTFDTVSIAAQDPRATGPIFSVRDNVVQNSAIKNYFHGLVHIEGAKPIKTHTTANTQFRGVRIPNDRQAQSYWNFTNAAAEHEHPDLPATNAIDGSGGSFWSTHALPCNSSTYLAAWPSGLMNPLRRVNLFARVHDGVSIAFPARYQLYITSPDNTTWNFVAEYTQQPVNGVVSLELPGAYQTHGVMIKATELTTDGSSNCYFQLAELGVQPW